MEERNYQTNDIIRLKESLKANKRVIYQLPTGGGKTVVATKIIKDYQSKNVLILAHKRKLISQMQNTLSQIDIEVGIMQGQNLINLESNMIVASIHTAVKDHKIDFLLKRSWDLIVVDEARRTRTNSYDKILDILKESNLDLHILGLDATPYRNDRKPLDYHFNEMIVSSENTYSLIQKGYLANTTTFVTPIGDIEDKVTSWGGDFQITQLSNYMRQPIYLDYILESWMKYAEGKQTIIFAVDKKHAEDIFELFSDNGVDSIAMINSDFSDEEVDSIFEEYEAGNIKVIINIEMITEGVDLPNTRCILIARPTQSLTLYLQILGRGLRKKQDNSNLIVIDCAGLTEKFGGVKTKHHWTLNTDIKPNGVSKMKIFGKSKEGKLTQDLSEYEGEVEELSPEEYMLQISSNKEIAEGTNLDIDNNIEQLAKKIENLLYSVFKTKPEFSDIFIDINLDSVSRWRITSIKAILNLKSIISQQNSSRKYRSSPYVIEIYLEQPKLILCKPDSYSSSSYHNAQHSVEHTQYTILSYACGYFNYEVLNNPIHSIKIYELVDEIVLLKSEKIDIDKFNQMSKEAEKEQYIQSARQASRMGITFEFPKKIYSNRLFKGRSRFESITSIRVEGSIRKHQNTIYLNNNTNEDNTKNYVTEEKIIEILTLGGWRADINEND